MSIFNAIFSKGVESFQEKKQETFSKILEKANESRSEADLLSLGRQAQTISNHARAVDRMERTASNASIDMIANIIGNETAISNALGGATMHDPKKLKQLSHYLATGFAPGESETACFAPLLEKLASGEIESFSKFYASEIIRKFKSVKAGVNLPQHNTAANSKGSYVHNNYKSYLTMLCKASKGLSILKVDGKGDSSTWTITPEGRRLVRSARIVRGNKSLSI
jgi:hypothetical protein